MGSDDEREASARRTRRSAAGEDMPAGRRSAQPGERSAVRQSQANRQAGVRGEEPGRRERGLPNFYAEILTDAELADLARRRDRGLDDEIELLRAMLRRAAAIGDHKEALALVRGL